MFATLSIFAFCYAGCDGLRERFTSSGNVGNVAAAPARVPKPEQSSSIHLMLGNPSGATADPANFTNYLLVGEISAISYNDDRGSANWISWRTTRSDLGDKIPRPDFRPDPRLPDDFQRIGHYDYSGSGLDRGHLVPSADRFADRKQNEQTFYLSNIVPQTKDLNQFPWEKLESYARYLARRGSDIYTIAGVYGDKGRLRRKVTIPTNCWKILLVLKKGQGSNNIDQNTRVIAVDMPNIDGIENDGWEKYKVSVRSIEQKTGYNFFDQLASELQDILETRIDR